VPLVPILLYHSVSSAPPPVIHEFAVDERSFRDHLDLIFDRQLASLTVAGFLEAVDRGDAASLERAVVITFDDGFADFGTAVPALVERGLTATLFVTTGLLRGAPEPVAAPGLNEHMLEWEQLPELHAVGIEIGAHSHSHPHLDTLGRDGARREIAVSRRLLNEAIGDEVETFAYPNGYSSRHVRRLVQAEGYRAACGVKDTFSSEHDDRFALARLMVRASTSRDDVARWLDRRGAPAPRAGERIRTRLWRAYRRGRAVVTRRPGSPPGWPAVRV
jgi:peptidoglycan/xylan/chitin deacetylase (PgdA/CDA1 family)